MSPTGRQLANSRRKISFFGTRIIGRTCRPGGSVGKNALRCEPGRVALSLPPEGIGIGAVFCRYRLMTSPGPHSALKAILWGGLLASLGDYLFAHLYYGWRLGVFQNVAGALLGLKAARSGGVPMYLLGTALHVLVGVIWAALFWGLARRLPALLKYAVPAGMVYGLMVYLGMNCVVLPLSALAVPLKLPPLVSWPAAAHLLLVGPPIALAARKFSTPAGSRP